ncbi:MAG: NADH-quinone oxidoreductase subunit H [Nitrospirae bacterium]|nr:NADH-quinone oxidoreductase subunit H [Nitrospirota bacterium]MCL5976848.1 NADH-quinone oxidoreductase subunit H [Nitrospirota bacterium]
MNGSIVEILQIVILIGLAPAFAGWIKVVKCRMQGRTSPGLFRPYRDLAKLFSKDIVLAENASWIFRFTPYLVFGTVIIAGAVVPMLSTNLPLSLTADAIVLVGLFGIARFFTALAGMDIGTAFGGMGSSREMMVASLAEPAMLMAIFTVSLLCGSTSLSGIAGTVSGAGFIAKPSLAFAFFAFVLIALAENGRIPVDNPATHLELTMLHEAMILEYSGRHLALIEWAGMMKLFLFMAIGSALFFPFGIDAADNISGIPQAFVFLVVKLGAAGVVLVLIETGLAKMRLFRLTEFLGSAFLMATLGMLSFFILE